MTDPIVLFGGTFDPPHYGHIKPLLALAELMSLSKVLLMPNKIPAHKAQPIANESQRLEMLELVAQQHSIFEIERCELDNQEVSYTANTIKRLQKSPDEQKCVFVMGTDSWLTISSWFDSSWLVKHVHFIVLSRPSLSSNKQTKAQLHARLELIAQSLNIIHFRVSTSNRDQVSLCKAAWANTKSSVTFCDLAEYAISSTHIRSVFNHGKHLASLNDDIKGHETAWCAHESSKPDSLSYLVPPYIERYIIENKLYGQISGEG